MMARSLAVPLENALDEGQAKNHLEMNRPWDDAPPVYYGLNPQITGVLTNHIHYLLILVVKLIINY